ncbi:MAG: GspH/FimT family pseudopilin [Comamonas sp.]
MHVRHRTVPHGFTLIELMATIAVLAIILTLAAPSFRQLLEAQRIRATAFDVVSDLILARSEALKRGATTTLAPAAGGWASGWSLTVGTEEISKKNQVGGGVSFATAPGSISFNGSGRVSSSASVVRFELRTSDASRQRCISLDPSGRPKSTTSACPT